MGIVGVLWFVGIFLKIFKVAAISWFWVILWPIPVILLLWLIIVICGVSIAGFSTLRR